MLRSHFSLISGRWHKAWDQQGDDKMVLAGNREKYQTAMGAAHNLDVEEKAVRKMLMSTKVEPAPEGGVPIFRRSGQLD